MRPTDGASNGGGVAMPVVATVERRMDGCEQPAKRARAELIEVSDGQLDAESHAQVAALLEGRLGLAATQDKEG